MARNTSIDPVSAIANAVGDMFQAGKAVAGIFSSKQNRKAMEADAEARKRRAEADEEIAQQQVYLQGRINSGKIFDGYYANKALDKQAVLARIKSGQNTILGLAVILVLAIFGYFIYQNYKK